MKKFISAISIALLTVILAFTLAGCDKSGAIEKAYEDNGYTVKITTTAENATVKNLISTILTEEQKKEIDKYALIYASKLLPPEGVVIIKFGSSGDLKDFLTIEDKDGNKDTSAYDAAKDAGHINGNCYFIVGGKDALNIFKNA
ncbi:MAG: hypothetical protein K2K80_02795 [Clostridia bacterium]|nr:hypothetical protein [Clostridia bacterium]